MDAQRTFCPATEVAIAAFGIVAARAEQRLQTPHAITLAAARQGGSIATRPRSTPVLRWMSANVAVAQDPAGNLKHAV